MEYQKKANPERKACVTQQCTKMRREFFILANVNETQRSSATLSGMNGRQNGKGASRWCS